MKLGKLLRLILRKPKSQQLLPKESPKTETLPYVLKHFDAYFYNAPRDTANNKLYVPVVLPNKDIFVWYLLGYHTAKESISEAIAMQHDEESEVHNSIELANSNGFNIFTIDSTRFNNVLPNDKREDKLSDDELDEFYSTLNDSVSEPDAEAHKENATDEESTNYGFFSVECPGCHLPYKFEAQTDIPETDFSCQCCSRLLIHYTGLRDSFFTYDNGMQDHV